MKNSKKQIQLFYQVCIFIIVSLFVVPTVSAKKYPVPEWAKKAVWYQIFPERFRNGDPTNDPTLEDIKGAWPFDAGSPIGKLDWTSDWYALQAWEQDDRGFYFHVQRRRYGGDLQGVLEKLDYLQELGINAIYLNPVFESPSLHKYDGSVFHHIDDNFGPDPAGDKNIMRQETPDDPSTWQWTAADKLFLKLLDECHRRNIRVIIDGVLNHVGVNCFAFVDLKKNQQQSPYKNWFNVYKWDDPQTPADEFDYQYWANVKNLPEIREDENGFDPAAWKYMTASIRRWMDPNGDGDPADGIDGWRLDVAEKVTIASWQKFRELTRSINPQCYLTGEVWWEEWPHKMFNAAPWLQGDMFDAVMNYRFSVPVTKFFIDQQTQIKASEFDSTLAKVRHDYPVEVNYVLQNLMDSHDTDRLSSMIVNPGRIYGHANRVSDNKDYLIHKPDADDIKIQKLIVLFQMTYLGAPMIYYGSEAGMWGASDPDERKPMLWADLTYDDEVSHPFGKKRKADKNVFDKKLFEYHKKLIRLRKKSSALMLGTFETLLTEDANRIYAFQRKYKDETVVVILNNSSGLQQVKLDIGDREWLECLKDKSVKTANGKLAMEIEGKTGVILLQKR